MFHLQDCVSCYGTSHILAWENDDCFGAFGVILIPWVELRDLDPGVDCMGV